MKAKVFRAQNQSMARSTLLFLAVFVVMQTWSIAQPRERDGVREARIEARLQAIEPAAVEDFKAATIALDKGELARAESLYLRVVAKLPKFDPALRRLGTVRVFLGKVREGIELCEQAVAIDRSSDNLLNLAGCLSSGSQEDMYKALEIAREARSLDRNDIDAAALICDICLRLDLKGQFRTALQELVQEKPGEMFTHYYAAIGAAMDERWLEARSEILVAEQLGLSHEVTQQFLDSGVGSNAILWFMGRASFVVVGGWLLGLFLLYAIGNWLSGLTMQSIGGIDYHTPGGGNTGTFRRFYRILINVAGVYYYISLPIVIIVVGAVTAGVFYLFMLIGYIPMKLLAIIGIGAIITIYKMIQSLFIKIKYEDPGRALVLEEAPAFWGLTAEVAKRVGTRPIDEIRITSGTDLAVYERGGWKEKLRDRGHRVLILGIAVLKDFRQRDFCSVLAHEYGHFSHRDTAGGDVALRVRNDMVKFFYAMVESGQAVRWNVAFHFLRLYDLIFRRISHGATRLQEILADRVAAQTYGGLAFQNGLTHVLRRSIEFNSIATREIDDSMKHKRPVRNLYELAPQSRQSIEDELKQALQTQTNVDDTHPSPADRFRLVEGIAAANDADGAALVWDLFKDPAALTNEMTSLIEVRVKANAHDYGTTTDETVIDPNPDSRSVNTQQTVCPQCNTTLDLNAEEVQAGSYQCPACGNTSQTPTS